MGTVTNLRQTDCFKEEKEEEEQKRARASRSNFDWFWSEYPKKKAKLEALKAWKETESVRPEVESLIAALDVQKQSQEWSNPTYIPYPSTWLRQGRWDDE